MKVERIIKGEMTEYKVELKLIDSYNYNRLAFEVYSREKGKRKWNFLEFSYQDKGRSGAVCRENPRTIQRKE